MQPSDSAVPSSAGKLRTVAWIRHWWGQQSPNRQDRFAMLAPLVAVVMFLAAIGSAFWYLRAEEIEREHEAVKRDVEYAQQRLRLRLLERQEQLMRLARDVSNRELNRNDFNARADNLINQYPELQTLSWIDEKRRVRASRAAPTVPASRLLTSGDTLRAGETDDTYGLTKDLQQPVYSQPLGTDDSALLQLHVPLNEQGRFAGVVAAEYSVDGLLRYGAPTEVLAKYAVSLIDAKGRLLAGAVLPPHSKASRLLPWTVKANEFEVPVSPIGNSLLLRAQGYRTSLGLIGSGQFWLVGVLSVMTAWMLIANWRHTRRRVRTQEALVAETNFRRAMENSILTGMRAMDMDGKVSYVNAAFCQMTGWTAQELVGQTPPFSYWPEEDHAALAARLREELSASYERFTIVLEALDASVSVAPLGSEELLFANKLYRLWFGAHTGGHLQLVAQAGVPTTQSQEQSLDDVDGLAGLPTESLTTAQAENAEIFVPELGKWLEVRSRYLNWVDGRLAQMVIATDITPRRQAEEQAAAQAERAQNASRLITMGEMASSVAHELNQPLTAINNYCNGMVSRIKDQQITEEALLAALEKTSKQAQRAGQIIQRIRSFVKRSEPNRTLSDISGMVSEAVELAEIELRRRNVRLSYYVAARLPRLLVDPILIEQVLVNLMKNASESIDAADRPSPRRSVELRVVPRQVDGQNAVEFSVVDTGQGLAPEVLERLYEAFFSTKAEGMGIGLNLCRSIIESHSGRMEAENLYNGADITGCRFSFWLPVSQQPIEGAARSAEQTRIPG